MTRFFLGIVLFGVSFSAVCAQAISLDNKMQIARQRCAKPKADEPVVYQSDFSWEQSPEQMKQKYNEIYNSNKRLWRRAYYNPEKDKFYFVWNRKGEDPIEVPERLIKSVTRHVEEALRLNYVEYVFFPDMGHSHFFVPMDFYQSEVREIKNQARRYYKILSHPDLKILYHTGEQLKFKGDDKKLVDNKWLQWRYYTRNPIGDNRAEGRLEIHLHQDLDEHNTVRNYEGFRYWSSGFSIQASREACFPFVDKSGKIQYFDLSLHDPPYDPEGGYGTED